MAAPPAPRMVINDTNFDERLLSILAALARASMISIDCEFSGTRIVVSTRDPSSSNGENCGSDSQTPEDKTLWDKFWEAVNRYSILQLGITCVWVEEEPAVTDPENLDEASYFSCESYSFIVNPFLSLEAGDKGSLRNLIDRDVMFNSYTMNFLNKAGIRLDDNILTGIPFLSKNEEEQIQQVIRRKKDQLEKYLVAAESLAMPNDGTPLDNPPYNAPDPSVPLAAYVRNWAVNEDGPELVIFPPAGCLPTRVWMEEVICYLKQNAGDTLADFFKDHENHGVMVKRRQRHNPSDWLGRSIDKMEKGLRQARGLRYILDYLFEKSLSRRRQPGKLPREIRDYLTESTTAYLLAPLLALSTLEGFQDCLPVGQGFYNMEACTFRDMNKESFEEMTSWVDKAIDVIDDAAQWLQHEEDGTHKLNRGLPFLVGHNITWDLAFIMANLYGPLSQDKPRALEQIRHLASGCIVDTKVLAKYYHPDLPNLNLESIYKKLMAANIPSNSIRWEHDFSCSSDQQAHNAGYDSFLTAVVYIKLAHARLQVARPGYSALEMNDAIMLSPRRRAAGAWREKVVNRLMVLGEEIDLDNNLPGNPRAELEATKPFFEVFPHTNGIPDPEGHADSEEAEDSPGEIDIDWHWATATHRDI